jgi:hypothetical protein
LESIIQIKYHPNDNLEKGKFILHVQGNNLYTNSTDHEQIPSASWCPPTPGWCKLNIDGSFGADASAGASMLLRDSDGAIVFSACRHILNCRDALESEIYSVYAGLSLALQWCSLPLVVESDCLEVVNMLKSEGIDRSVYAPMIEEIKTLLKVHHTCITHVKRCQNSSSHFLANLARTSASTAVWLESGLEGLASLCYIDCNP